MTEPQHDPPLPPVSRQEERQRLLAEALAHASAQDEAFHRLHDERGWTARWKAPLTLLLFLLAAYVAVFPPSWLAPATPPGLGAGELERGARAALYLEAQQIEAYRVARGRLPSSLDELPTRIPGIVFVRSNNRVYQLVARGPDGSSLVYDSARPAPAFARAAAGWAEGAVAR